MPFDPADPFGIVEPVAAIRAAVDVPRLVRSDDKGSTYELTLAGTAALPPFPEQPDVAAALGAGPLEVEPIDTTLPADAADLDCLNS